MSFFPEQENMSLKLPWVLLVLALVVANLKPANCRSVRVELDSLIEDKCNDHNNEGTTKNPDEPNSDTDEGETTFADGENESTTIYDGLIGDNGPTTTTTDEGETTFADGENESTTIYDGLTTTPVPTPSTTLNITNCCMGNEWEENNNTDLFLFVTGTRRYKRCLDGIFFKTPEIEVYNDNQCCPNGNWEKVEFPPNVGSPIKDQLYQCSGIKFFTIF